MNRGVLQTVGYLLGLSSLMGLAIVQSTSYLHNYVTHSGSPIVMYAAALLIGLALGLVTERFSLLLVTPLAVILAGALIFFVVAYSPVWTGHALGNVTIINELTRQVILVVFVNLVPAYLGPSSAASSPRRGSSCSVTHRAPRGIAGPGAADRFGSANGSATCRSGPRIPLPSH